MSYIALYRKYRPKTFDEVYGQSAIVQTLKNQIIHSRIGHAYLLCGPRGTGKTSIAKILSQAVNCESPVNGSACGTCKCCQEHTNRLNVDIIEIDAASNNGVDNIRDLIEESKYMPQYGKYKVYIIDEVHMLSNSAFNALLKTLEEPSPNVIFILATTEEHKVLPTISSRCQKFQFKLLSDDELVEAMENVLIQENIPWESDGLNHIAKLAKGGLRDALSLLDQCVTFSNNVTLENVRDVFGEIDESSVSTLAEYIRNGDVAGLLQTARNLYMDGKQLTKICSEMYEYYRDECFNDKMDSVIAQRYMRIFAELQEKLKHTSNYAIFEIELIKVCKPQMEKDYNSLYERIQQMERVIETGNLPVAKQQLNNFNPEEFVKHKVTSCRRPVLHIY